MTTLKFGYSEKFPSQAQYLCTKVIQCLVFK